MKLLRKRKKEKKALLFFSLQLLCLSLPGLFVLSAQQQNRWSPHWTSRLCLKGTWGTKTPSRSFGTGRLKRRTKKLWTLVQRTSRERPCSRLRWRWPCSRFREPSCRTTGRCLCGCVICVTSHVCVIAFACIISPPSTPRPLTPLTLTYPGYDDED